MAFINIFDYKKYFSSKGDSNVARIGHVNKLAARVTSPAAVTQLTDNGTAVTIDSYAGVITMFGPLTVGGSFTVNNSFVSNSSCIQVTLEYAGSADLADRVDLAILDVADGSFKVVINTSAAPGAPIGPCKIHFLVIS
jgi:hypothetical protein